MGSFYDGNTKKCGPVRSGLDSSVETRRTRALTITVRVNLSSVQQLFMSQDAVDVLHVV